MKPLRVLVVSTIFVLRAVCANTQEPTQENDALTLAAERAAWSVVAIMDSHSDIFCTGFVIDTENGYVLTADHCLSLGLQYYDEARVDGALAEEICHDVDRDLSLLKTTTEKPALGPRNEPYEVGLPVIGLGFADGGKLKAVAGSVLVIGFPMYDQQWLLTGIGEPGMSGGPIVDAESRVVGLIQMYVPGHPEADFGNSVADLRAFIEMCDIY